MGGNMKFSLFLFIACWVAHAEDRPSEADIWVERGSAFIQERDNDHAKDAYQQALQLDPNNEKAQFGMGLLLFFSCHPRSGVQHLQRATQLPRKDDGHESAFWLLGLAQRNLGNVESARAAFTQYKAEANAFALRFPFSKEQLSHNLVRADKKIAELGNPSKVGNHKNIPDGECAD